MELAEIAGASTMLNGASLKSKSEGFAALLIFSE